MGENKIIPACELACNCDRKMKYWSWSILMVTKKSLNTLKGDVSKGCLCVICSEVFQ
jgi:hypothetical protein